MNQFMTEIIYIEQIIYQQARGFLQFTNTV